MVAQTEPPSFYRIDYFTRQNQFARAFFANHQRQKHRADRRKHAELYLRLTKTRAIGSNHDVARRNQFTSAAKCCAINKRNRRFRELFQQAKDRVKRVEHLKDRFLNVLFNCDAGTERTTILVGIEHDRDELALRTLTQRRSQSRASSRC